MSNHETFSTNSDNQPNPWEDLVEESGASWDELSSEVEETGAPEISSEPYDGSAFEANLGNDAYGFEEEDILEDLPDGTPQILWRGERVYLDNIDEVGTKTLTTKGNEGSANRDGTRLCTARDKEYTLSYALGKDGRPTFYDAPPSAEEIPIGVIYRINNENNHLNMTSEDQVDGYFRTQQREYATAGDIPPEDYEPVAFILGNDLTEFVYRSDFRMPQEVFEIDHEKLKSDPEYLQKVIAAVKARHQELFEKRKV